MMNFETITYNKSSTIAETARDLLKQQNIKSKKTARSLSEVV